MPRSHAVWSAPSIESLSHSNIRLDCAPEVIRGVWNASTRQDCLEALATYFAATTPPGEQSPYGKAEDFFYETQQNGFRGLRSLGDHKRTMIDKLAGFHGVEYLGVHRRAGKVVRYCNAGDSYAPTLCFMGRRMFIATVGDLIEDRKVKREDD